VVSESNIVCGVSIDQHNLVAMDVVARVKEGSVAQYDFILGDKLIKFEVLVDLVGLLALRVPTAISQEHERDADAVLVFLENTLQHFLRPSNRFGALNDHTINVRDNARHSDSSRLGLQVGYGRLL